MNFVCSLEVRIDVEKLLKCFDRPVKTKDKTNISLCLLLQLIIARKWITFATDSAKEPSKHADVLICDFMLLQLQSFLGIFKDWRMNHKRINKGRSYDWEKAMFARIKVLTLLTYPSENFIMQTQFTADSSRKVYFKGEWSIGWMSPRSLSSDTFLVLNAKVLIVFEDSEQVYDENNSSFHPIFDMTTSEAPVCVFFLALRFSVMTHLECKR